MRDSRNEMPSTATAAQSVLAADAREALTQLALGRQGKGSTMELYVLIVEETARERDNLITFFDSAKKSNPFVLFMTTVVDSAPAAIDLLRGHSAVAAPPRVDLMLVDIDPNEHEGQLSCLRAAVGEQCAILMVATEQEVCMRRPSKAGRCTCACFLLIS